MELHVGVILTFIAVIVIFGFIYYYSRKNLSYYADEKSPQLEIMVIVKNAQDEIEGLVREYYKKQANQEELWIIDCGSLDETPRILEKLSRRFPGLRLLFLSDTPHQISIPELLNLTNAPALLLVDGTYLKYKEVLELTILLHI